MSDFACFLPSLGNVDTRHVIAVQTLTIENNIATAPRSHLVSNRVLSAGVSRIDLDNCDPAQFGCLSDTLLNERMLPVPALAPQPRQVLHMDFCALMSESDMDNALGNESGAFHLEPCDLC